MVTDTLQLHLVVSARNHIFGLLVLPDHVGGGEKKERQPSPTMQIIAASKVSSQDRTKIDILIRFWEYKIFPILRMFHKSVPRCQQPEHKPN